jgi:hypothetical protein
MNSIIEIDQHGAVNYTDNQPALLGVRQNTDIAKPVRPLEFSLWVAGPFVNLFVILAIALGVIYAKAHVNGTFPYRQPIYVSLDTDCFQVYLCLLPTA